MSTSTAGSLLFARATFGTSPIGEAGVANHERLAVMGHAFEEIAVFASSDNTELDEVLRLIGRRLSELLGVCRCSVYLRRKDGRFQGQVGFDANGPSIDGKVSRLVSGVDSFTTQIVSSGSPVIIHDAARDPRTNQRTMRQWRVQDMLGVPLVIDGEVIGIIYLDDRTRPHDFSDEDVELATAFAGLSASLVKNVWQREVLVRKINASDRVREIMARVSTARAAITESMARGCDLDDLLQAVADQLGKPVALHAPNFESHRAAQPSKNSGPSACALTPDDVARPSNALLMAKLEGRVSSVVFRPSAQVRSRRLVVRLAVAEEPLGYLEVIEQGSIFEPADGRVAEELAAMLALKISMDHRVGSQEFVDHDDFLRDLLLGRRESHVLEQRSEAFGIDPRAGHVIAVQSTRALTPSGVSDSHDDDSLVRPVPLSTGSVNGLRIVGTVCTRSHVFSLIECGESFSSRAGLRPSLTSLARALIAGSGPVILSDLCPDFGQIPAALGRATGVWKLFERYPGCREDVVLAGDLELVRLVDAGGGLDDAVQSAQDLLRPLIDGKLGAGKELLATLSAFIDSGGQFRATALALKVHENTVRYRLQRIASLSSLDPANLGDLGRAQFALQVRQLTQR